MATDELTNEDNTHFSIDALMPREMARKAEDIGVKKAYLDFISMSTLAILAGAFIALGAIFATVAWTGASSLPLWTG